MEELRGQRVLVLGLGISGRSAATFCASRGARVLAVDERKDIQTQNLPEEVEVQLGGSLPDPRDFDLVVPSPGVARERYAQGARRICGDVALAIHALRIPVVAVTGTNGKSTTVRLAEAMLRAAGWRAMAAGNVGHPALDLVGQPLDAAVLEISSFQLEAADDLRPQVAVCLAVTPDHLDRHHDLAAYRAAKRRIFAAQRAEDLAVLDADDAWLAEIGPGLPARVLWFSCRRPVERGAFLDGECVCLAGGEEVVRLPLAGLSPDLTAFPGNLMAAFLAVQALGADLRKAQTALPGFASLPHRNELVAERREVLWIDDSKATNPGAAAAALARQSGPVIWIAGGRDKGLPFEALGQTLGRVRIALLIGESAPRLAAALAGKTIVETAGTLEAAVERAAALARPGDVVLLSPACASFDQFASFEERGERFRSLVEARA